MMRLLEILRNWVFERRLASIQRRIVAGEGNIYMRGFGLAGELSSPDQYTLGSQCVLAHQVVFERPGHGRVRIGDRCHIGGKTTLVSMNCIDIGSDVTIAWDCFLYDHDSHSLDWQERSQDTLQEIQDYKELGNPIARKNWSTVKSAPIVIQDKAWLGMGVTVLKGVTIGEGAVVGARSVVTRDIPPYCVAAGNPARVIRNLRETGV